MVFVVSTFPITNDKKGEGEARNEESRGHKHLLFSWPHNSISLKRMLFYNLEMSIMICIVLYFIN